MSRMWRFLGTALVLSALVLVNPANFVLAQTPELDPSPGADQAASDPGETEVEAGLGAGDDAIENEGSGDLGSSGRLEEQPDGAVPLQLSAPLVMPMAATGWVEQRNQRIFGETRYDTAVAVSRQAYPSGASTVLIATGRDFPDSLGAAALGAKINAPLLLVDRGTISASTRAEIARLKPNEIVIIGGTSVVPASVENTMKSYAKSVKRLAGADRYATSAAIAKAGWKTSPNVFIATGVLFADALSAAAAAGELDAPVILVPGGNSTAPASVKNVISSLKPTRVHVAGGTAAISTALQKSATGSSVAVTRYSGATRYETSANIAAQVFKGKQRDTYLATGESFADALTGAAVAGAQGAPLILVAKSCIPSASYQANDSISSGRTYLLGGTQVLSNSILHGNECMSKPAGASTASWSGTQQLYKKLNSARYSANLSPFRAADSIYGTPAFSWASSMTKGGVKPNPKLSAQQPWSVYQTVGQTGASGDKASRLASLFLANPQAGSWLLKPSGGIRGVFSAGYVESGSKGYATVIVGTNLK